MGAVRAKALADLHARRLQTLVIGTVLFLASAAATLALNILVESHAPFDRAFAAANGAHLIIEYDGTIDPGQLEATSSAPSVNGSAGPWPVGTGLLGHPMGGLVDAGNLSGRPQPGPSIDSVTISAGRWWQAPGEAVLDETSARLLDMRVGGTVQVFRTPTGKTPIGKGPEPDREKPVAPPEAAISLTVVGIAGSVSTPDVGAWISPTDIAALTPGHPPAQQMLYRVDPSATVTDLAAAMTDIVGDLPAEAVVTSQTYLDVKAGVDQLADLYVPILLAFSMFALLAAAFTIVNVVSGVVLTSYRDIGVMKAIGYTPAQVSGILVAQILLPVAIGAIAGVIVGTVASQPIVEQTALSFGLPASFAISVPVLVGVLAITLATATLAAIGPATHAGRLSAVAAMTRGTAPSAQADGGRLRRLGLRLPFRLPVRLGIAAGVAHPLRASMTLGALVVGVAALTFAIGLNWSLLRVMADLGRSEASPVRVEVGNPATNAASTTTTIADDPGTLRSVAIGQSDGTVSPIGIVPFVGYEGDSSWIGYALIQGRWFTSAGEAVAPSNFFRQTGLGVGDTTTISRNGRSVTVRLVGEIFDAAEESRDNLVLRGTWADLAALEPSIEPTRWEVQPRDGVGARAYREALQGAFGRDADVYIQDDSTSDESFLLFLTVIGVMGTVLVAISLGGVFNTVLLETRQRTREIAVLKSIGLTPAQVVGMVLASIVPIGIVAGVLGVPLGLAAQRAVLLYMGEVAAKTGIPPAIFDVFSPAMLAALGLAGLAIGAIGAYLPAQRAARARIAPVLQAE